MYFPNPHNSICFTLFPILLFGNLISSFITSINNSATSNEKKWRNTWILWQKWGVIHHCDKLNRLPHTGYCILPCLQKKKKWFVSTANKAENPVFEKKKKRSFEYVFSFIFVFCFGKIDIIKSYITKQLRKPTDLAAKIQIQWIK